ncbi:hypothetical protein ACHAXN_013275 [Cyclotella atomus]
MVHPHTSLPLLTLTTLLAALKIHDQIPSVEAWIPRGGGMASINGQPNRLPSTSSLFMKKRDKKQKKKTREFQLEDVDGIGQLAADNFFSYDYFTSDFVARLETMYGMNDGAKQDSSILKEPKRIKIQSEDWSELAEGPCLSDCCGEECDEQCEIPEYYKRFANKDAKVDVMAFLGIKRAEPLRVQRDWD